MLWTKLLLEYLKHTWFLPLACGLGNAFKFTACSQVSPSLLLHASFPFVCLIALFCFVLLDLFCTHTAPTRPVDMGIAYFSTSKTPSFPESTHEMSGWDVFPAHSHLSLSPLLISKAGDFTSNSKLKLSQSATGFITQSPLVKLELFLSKHRLGDGWGGEQSSDCQRLLMSLPKALTEF